MALAQAAYQFGANDNNEATHTFLAAINTPIARDATDESTFLLRMLIQASGAVAHSNLDIQFQYRLNAGAYTDITITSAVVRAVATAIFANAANTTSRLGGTGTFETTSQGCTHDGLAGGTAFDIVADGRGEVLASLRLVAADLAPGDVITFRILFDGATMTETVTPTINVIGPTTITLDTATIAGDSTDALASGVLTLDVGSLAFASSDLTTFNTTVIELDIAAASLASEDLLAAANVALDTASISAANEDVAAALALTLDIDEVVLASEDIAATEQGAVLLDTGAIGIVGNDLSIDAQSTIELDTGSVTAAGFEQTPILSVALEDGAVVAQGEDVLTGGEVLVILDGGVVSLLASNLVAAPDVAWQEFIVDFEVGQEFICHFEIGTEFEVAA